MDAWYTKIQIYIHSSENWKMDHQVLQSTFESNSMWLEIKRYGSSKNLDPWGDAVPT